MPRSVAKAVAPAPPADEASVFEVDRRKKINVAAAQFLGRYRFDPNLFAEEVLQIELDPWQREANEAVADYVRASYGEPVKVQDPRDVKRWFTVRAMHGPGKTFWGGQLILWFGSVFPNALVPCIAPKMDQLKTRLWREMRLIRARATPAFQAITSDIGAISLKWFGRDEWTAFGQTAVHAENLSGLHSDFMLVFVDEATGVAEELFPTIFGALSTGLVVILVMISNPTRLVGTFAQSWNKPRVAKRYWQVAITLDKAPRVSRDWVRTMAEKYSEQSPVYKIRCLGEFADDSPYQLIATEWIFAALAREPPDLRGETTKLRVSIDVADGGVDETVVTAAREHSLGRTVLKMKRFSFQASVSPIEAADAGERMFEAFGGRKGVDEFVVDGLGVGAGTAGTLLKRGQRVVVHKGGEQASDPDRWRNRRVQNHIAMRDAYREGRVSFAADWCGGDEQDAEELTAQLASVQTNPATDRVDDLVTKEQMKADGLKSPDMEESLSMQWSTAQSAGQGLMDHVRLAAEAVEARRGPTGAAALMAQQPKKAPLSQHPAARDVPIVTTETV